MTITASFSPVVKYHGLARRYPTALGFLMRPLLNGGTLGGQLMQLRDIVQVVALEQDDSADDVFPILAVIRGDQVFGHSKPGWLWENGEPVARLTPELEVDAAFMRFDCIGHYPICCLFFSESLHDLEQDILESYFNPFTTYTCAFVNGDIRRFECSYRDADGTLLVFDKPTQLDRDGFGGDYRERRLRWLP